MISLVACITLLGFVASRAAAAQSLCALSNTDRADAQPACSPYVTSGLRVIATFPRRVFRATYVPDALAGLADGSAVIAESPYALFRTQSDGSAVVLWAPPGSRYFPPEEQVRHWAGTPPPLPSPTPASYSEFYLLGSFDDTAVIQYGPDFYGIKADGSISFRFAGASDDLMEQFLGRDPDGTFWFASGGNLFFRDPDSKTVHAFFLSSQNVVPLPEPVEQAFQGPSGFIYARVGQDLVELRSLPRVQARYYRGPIALEAGRNSGRSEMPVSRIGADGSAWAATPFQVIHEHPDGRVNVIGLSSYPTTITHMPVPLELHLAPDGSAWIARNYKLVRITKEDRVQVMDVPFSGYYPDLQISSDSTVWLKTPDDARTILHVASI